MKQKWFRKLIGGLSFTTAFFIFQSCYGTPQDFGLDLYITGHVKSKTTRDPIVGIKVSVVNMQQYQYTDNLGMFSLYTESNDTVNIKFQDVDSAQNGNFNDKDTILINPTGNVVLEILMEEK
jgi:hypothetical protein